MRTLLLGHPVWVVELALLLMVVVVGVTSWTTSDRSAGISGTHKVLGPSQQPVTIHGDVQTPITLGASMAIDLSLNNPNEFALTIEKVTVTVLEVEAPRADAEHPCSAVDFSVRQLDGRTVLTLASDSEDNLSDMAVPRGSWPAVGLLNRPINQDGCKGAFLKLGYEATGAEADE